MTTPSTNNRRRWQRVAHDIPVIVVTTDGTINTYEARDLSAGGAYLFAEQSPEPGARVRVDLTLRRPVVTDGVVVRQEPTGFAIEFRDMPEADRRALSELLETNGLGKTSR